jgi:S1-C subfamily serine protease
MRPYDVIVGFDGTDVLDASHFLRLLADAKIGSTVEIVVVREGRRLRMGVEVTQAGSRRT